MTAPSLQSEHLFPCSGPMQRLFGRPQSAANICRVYVNWKEYVARTVSATEGRDLRRSGKYLLQINVMR